MMPARRIPPHRDPLPPLVLGLLSWALRPVPIGLFVLFGVMPSEHSRVYWACKDTGKSKTAWNPPASFERSTNKFWVHPHKVSGEGFSVGGMRVA